MFRPGIPIPCEIGQGATRPQSPKKNDIFYDTTRNELIMFDGSVWYDPSEDIFLKLFLK